MKTRLLTTIALAGVATAVLAASAAGSGRTTLYQFRGELLNTSTSSVTVQVEGGNRPALRAMLGNAQNQTFTLGPRSQVLIWRQGIPKVGAVADLHAGDWVTVSVRAGGGSTLAELESHAVGRLADRLARPAKPSNPLYLYVGTVSGPQSGGKVALHVTGGNKRALRTLLGQSPDQVFTYDAGTFFLLWQGRVPSVIDASQLKAGDRITIRVRAPRASTLAQVTATAANRIGDHEPGNPTAEN